MTPTTNPHDLHRAITDTFESGLSSPCCKKIFQLFDISTEQNDNLAYSLTKIINMYCLDWENSAKSDEIVFRCAQELIYRIYKSARIQWSESFTLDVLNDALNNEPTGPITRCTFTILKHYAEYYIDKAVYFFESKQSFDYFASGIEFLNGVEYKLEPLEIDPFEYVKEYRNSTSEPNPKGFLEYLKRMPA